MTENVSSELVVAADAAALAQEAARRIAASLGRAVARAGRATLALSGGSTPLATYERLAARDDVPWDDVVLLWVDERFVAWESDRSNYGEAARSWLSRVPVAEAHVHPMPAPLPAGFDPDAIDWAAAAYEATLRRATGCDAPDVPVIDLVVLGVGTDGHTASLFPGSGVLEESERAVAPVPPEADREPRITLTFPVLLAARERLVLCTGASKRAVVATALAGPRDAIPAARLRDATGPTTWLVDRDAAPSA